MSHNPVSLRVEDVRVYHGLFLLGTTPSYFFLTR